MNGLYKKELIRRKGPWHNLDHVEFETLTWVSWFNSHRLLESIGYIPPAEFETAYYRNQPTLAMAAGVNEDTTAAALDEMAAAGVELVD